MDYSFTARSFWGPGIRSVCPLHSQNVCAGSLWAGCFSTPFPVHREFERMFCAPGRAHWPAVTPTGEGT